MEKTIKIADEEFTIRSGEGDCQLEVINGGDIGRVFWHAATYRFRGEFKGWGSDADTVDGAVSVAARRIIAVRKGVSQKQACEEMEKYLSDC